MVVAGSLSATDWQSDGQSDFLRPSGVQRAQQYSSAVLYVEAVGVQVTGALGRHATDPFINRPSALISAHSSDDWQLCLPPHPESSSSKSITHPYLLAPGFKRWRTFDRWLAPTALDVRLSLRLKAGFSPILGTDIRHIVCMTNCQYAVDENIRTEN